MPFDIESYKLTSKKLDLSDIAWDEVPRHTPPQGAIDSMLYMMDIETHTAIYLSELLVSKACMDPVIMAFLSIWGYEEMYHGDAFLTFLRAYGLEIADDRATQIRLSDNVSRISASSCRSGRITRSIAPWRRSSCEKAPARAVTRWFMLKRAKAVGEEVKSSAEVDRLALYLFDGEDGRKAVRAIDRALGELPGLSGIPFMMGVLDRALARAGAGFDLVQAALINA